MGLEGESAMAGTTLSDDLPLDAEASRLLALASWIGHLQRERRGLGSSVPPGHWHDVLAALLIAEDRTSRWMQAAADNGLLLRALLLPDPTLAWRAKRGAVAGLAPAGGDGVFTRSVRGALLPEAAKLRIDGDIPIGTVHLTAALLFGSNSPHEKELYALAPPDGERLKCFAAIWLIEFGDRLAFPPGLHQRVDDWFDGVNRYDRLGMSEPMDAWCPDFTRQVAMRQGGGSFGPWLEALFALEQSAGDFLASERETLRRCLISGEVTSGKSSNGLRGGAVLVERARVLASRVSPGQRPDPRHLLGALLAADATLPPLPADPPGSGTELRALRRRLVATVPAKGDLQSAWADAILGESLARVPLMLDSGSEDRLGFRRYARALASVIADKSVAPPLSIGLFGAWGSGKSFLIERIREELLDIASRAEPGVSGFCRRVVPVDFNAWHYAETDLWASLFVCILESLRNHLSGKTEQDSVLTRGEVLAELSTRQAELGIVEAAAAADAPATGTRIAAYTSGYAELRPEITPAPPAAIVAPGLASSPEKIARPGAAAT